MRCHTLWLKHIRIFLCIICVISFHFLSFSFLKHTLTFWCFHYTERPSCGFYSKCQNNKHSLTSPSWNSDKPKQLSSPVFFQAFFPVIFLIFLGRVGRWHPLRIFPQTNVDFIWLPILSLLSFDVDINTIAVLFFFNQGRAPACMVLPAVIICFLCVMFICWGEDAVFSGVNSTGEITITRFVRPKRERKSLNSRVNGHLLCWPV